MKSVDRDRTCIIKHKTLTVSKLKGLGNISHDYIWKSEILDQTPNA